MANTPLPASTMAVVDAYTHCGLRKYEPIERVQACMESAGVRRAVLVQHLGEFDNSYLAGIATRHPDRFAAIGMIDSTDDSAEEELYKLARSSCVRGIRFPADSIVQQPRLWDVAADLGLIVMIYAAGGLCDTADDVGRWLDHWPRARAVITHLGNPRLDDAPDFESQRCVMHLARHPGVYYQVSGMKMFCPYPHEVLYPLIARAVEAFGTDRLLWGSNYPVVGDSGAYQSDLDLLQSGTLPIPAEAIRAVAGGNAIRLYFT